MGVRLVALHAASQRWVWRWLYVAALPWLAMAAWGATLGVTRLAVYALAVVTFIAWLAMVMTGAYFFVLGLALLAVLGIGFLRPGFGGIVGTNPRVVVGVAGVGSLVAAGLLFSPTPVDPDVSALPITSVSQTTFSPATTAPSPTLTPSVPISTTTAPTSPTGPVLLRVIDGDTIKVLVDGKEESVRLIGIDANESGDCFADEATDRLAGLLAGEFEIKQDVSNRDQFGRLLRYVVVDGEPVSVTLAAEGLAIARRYPPDVVFAEVLEAAQNTARVNAVGIWDADSCGPGEPSLALSADGTELGVANVGSGLLNLGDASVVAGTGEIVTFESWFALLPGEVAEVLAGCGDNWGMVVYACAGGLWPPDVALAVVGSTVAFAELPPPQSTTSTTDVVVVSSPSDVVISYIHPDAAGNDNESANKNDEYFDLTNEGAAGISMSGWKVVDEGVNHTYRFPNSYVLELGTTVRIHTGCGTNDAEHLYWCKGGSAVWNNDGDTVTLIGPDGSVVDTWGY